MYNGVVKCFSWSVCWKWDVFYV